MACAPLDRPDHWCTMPAAALAIVLTSADGLRARAVAPAASQLRAFALVAPFVQTLVAVDSLAGSSARPSRCWPDPRRARGPRGHEGAAYRIAVRPADVLRCPCVAREQPAALGWVCTGDRVLHRPPFLDSRLRADARNRGWLRFAEHRYRSRGAHAVCARCRVRAIIVNMSAAQSARLPCRPRTTTARFQRMTVP